MRRPSVQVASATRRRARMAVDVLPGWLSFGWLIGGAIALALAVPVHAAQSGVAAGYVVAKTNCAGCHVITGSGTAGWTDAPAFAAIANRTGTTKASLVTLLMKPNMKMIHQPRSEAEADIFADYILSLRKP